MRIARFALLLACSLPVAVSLPAQQPQQVQLTGTWLVTMDLLGNPAYSKLELTQSGDKLTGNFNGDKLQGQVQGANLHLLSTDDQGNTGEANAQITQNASGIAFAGKVVFVNKGDESNPEQYTFTATRYPKRYQGSPQRRDFTPTVFYRQFSHSYQPVLTINPGDTLHTTTVDAGGTDEKGVHRVLGGNPETGPFYIETAMPGDTLVVHIVHLKLNRDWAMSDDGIVDRATDSDLAVKMKDGWKNIRWHLDSAKGIATPEKPGEHMAHYSIPLKPMLGCLATAPRPTSAPPPTGDSGGFGGNMDFNEIVEGATVYLPVRNPGALLYFGDGHAAQGDGELNGNALETSMDVEITVDVIPGKNIGSPRVESATHIMSMGLGGSLEDALRGATAAMAEWLTEDYKLTPSEIAQLLGSSAEYRISEVADRNAGIVLKLNKALLKNLAAPPPK